MATLTTIDGVEITFNADGVAVISEDGAGSDVFGATTGMLKIRETPPAFMARLGIVAKFVQLTRPNGSPVWINGSSVSSLRAPLPREYPPTAKTVVVTGPLTQAIEEAPEAARTAINTHGGNL